MATRGPSPPLWHRLLKSHYCSESHLRLHTLESYIKIKLWEIIKPSYMNVFFIIRVLKFFFITALRPTHRLLLCSLQKALLQFLLTWRERNTVHREKSSSLLASIPLSSACLTAFTTAALQEPSGAGGVTGEVDQASLQKTTHRTGGQVEFSKSHTQHSSSWLLLFQVHLIWVSVLCQANMKQFSALLMSCLLYLQKSEKSLSVTKR